MSGTRILVVDDEPDIRMLVKEILEDEGYAVEVAEDGETARQRLPEVSPDLIMLDIWMPGIDGITLLKEWAAAGALTGPVIMMSGHGTVETAVEATRLGAYDFLEKPLSLGKLLLTVERALDADRLRRENQGLKQRASTEVVQPLGRSATMQQLSSSAEELARLDGPLLLSGELGSGKATFARYIHSQSRRASQAFVETRLMGLGREAGMKALFGSEQTGEAGHGLLEQARGGVLLIRDIAHLEADSQAMLLQALKSDKLQRPGSGRVVELDVRLMVATDRDLAQLVEQGHFNQALFELLAAHTLHIPALRDHADDVLDLSAWYLERMIDTLGTPWRRISIAGQNRLRQYHWPGNVCELINVLQRLLILADHEEIGGDEVSRVIGDVAADGETGSGSGAATLPDYGSFYDLPLREARERFERAYFEHHLALAEGNVSKLSKTTGMERTNLYRKLKNLKVDTGKNQ